MAEGNKCLGTCQQAAEVCRVGGQLLHFLRWDRQAAVAAVVPKGSGGKPVGGQGKAVRRP